MRQASRWILLALFLVVCPSLFAQVQVSGNRTIITQGGNDAAVNASNDLEVEVRAGATAITATGTSLNINCTGGCAAAGDTAGTAVSLAAVNNAATVALAGENGADVIFTVASSPVFTVVAEVSPDAGTTWFSAVFFDPVSGATSTSLVNPANGQWQIGYVGAQSNARVRVSAFTSGSITAQLRATVTAPHILIYGSDGTNLRPIATTAAGLVNIGSIASALPTGANTIGAVTQASGPWTINHTQTAGTVLGAISAYGTSPGAVNVESVNAFVTNVPAVTVNAGTALVGKTLPLTACGTTNYDAAWQALPTSATAVTATTTCVQNMTFCNTNASSTFTVTVTDNQGTPINVINASSIPPASCYNYPFNWEQFTSGIKWNGSNAAITGAIHGVQ